MVNCLKNARIVMQLNIRKRLSEYLRVLKITKKPNSEEFLMSVKVTGAGMAIIGTIGLLIYFVAVYSKLFS